MKKITLVFLLATIFMAGCATVQSIIKSTFPYTSSLIIPASTKINSTASATSSATSFDQVFGNQNSTDYIKEVRISSAKIMATNPNSQNLGVFKSVKIYISNGNSGEVMVASRKDISENIGSDLILDIDNSRFLDNYIKGSNLKVRMEYVLRKSLTKDVSVKAALNFSTSPNTK
jgi:uncharacterized protein YceK